MLFDSIEVKHVKNSSGFSLIEILLVLGLIALSTGLVVINADVIFSGFEERPLSEILHKVVREARFLAAKNREPVYVSFDPEGSNFLITNRENSVLESISSGYPGDDSDLEIILYRLLPEKGLSSFRGLSTNRKPVDRLVFHPDRSSTPFEVGLRYGEEQSLHRYDPFSDSEIENSNP